VENPHHQLVATISKKKGIITGKWQVFLRNVERMHFNATDFAEEES
jgi:hypothetical protein